MRLLLRRHYPRILVASKILGVILGSVLIGLILGNRFHHQLGQIQAVQRTQNGSLALVQSVQRTQDRTLRAQVHSLRAQLHTLALVQAVQRSLDLSLLESCDRLNRLRAQSNVSNLADWTLLNTVIAESKLIPFTARHGFLNALNDAKRRKIWTPLTDCQRAVNLHGVRYRSPEAIPFYVRLPPDSALAP